MQLSEIIPDFLLAKEVEEGCSANTIKAYGYDLRMFQAAIGDPDLDRIRVIHIRKFLKILHDKGYTKQSLGRKIACLKAFFKFCVENEVIERNPMGPIKSPRIRPEEALPKYLSQAEITNLLALGAKSHSVPTMGWASRVFLMSRVLYASMARVSEICHLRISDVHISEQSIKVRGKGNKERLIPLDIETIELLKEHITNRRLVTEDEAAPLFVNNRGTKIQPRTVQRDIHKLKEKLGLSAERKLTPHIFRHTGATHLRQNGMDISELQDLLGHSNPNTTRIYAKNDITRLSHSYQNYHPLAQKKE